MCAATKLSVCCSQDLSNLRTISVPSQPVRRTSHNMYPSSSLPYPLISLHTLSLPYNYTQTIPSRSPSLVLPSISSLCTLCTPQSEYHLQYSSLWSDPIHVLSLTHSQLTHLQPFSSSTTLMSPSTSSCLRQGPTVTTVIKPTPIHPIPTCLHPSRVTRITPEHPMPLPNPLALSQANSRLSNALPNTPTLSCLANAFPT